MTFLCPGVDATAWGVRNRVTLHPGRVQTWILAHSHGGSPESKTTLSDADARRQARAVMQKWFGEGGSALGSRSGAADLIEVGDPSTAKPRLGTVLQTRSQLPGPSPLLRPGKIIYVPVSFAWRSQRTTMPWPTWRVDWGLGSQCPDQADWMLAEVGAPAEDVSELPEAPPEDKGPLEQAGETLDTIAEWAPVVGVVALGVGVAYVVNSFRRRT